MSRIWPMISHSPTVIIIFEQHHICYPIFMSLGTKLMSITIRSYKFYMTQVCIPKVKVTGQRQIVNSMLQLNLCLLGYSFISLAHVFTMLK